MINNKFFISQENDNSFSVWSLDFNNPNLFTVKCEKTANLNYNNNLIQVGNYILQWSPKNDDDQYSYQLLQFNPDEKNPLGSQKDDGTWINDAVQAGYWSKRKFFSSRADFSNAGGATKSFQDGKELALISMHNFVLNWIPTQGRGTYQLFNFDHGNSDPLPAPVTPQGAWLTIEDGHNLMCINGYVLDWTQKSGDFSVWQFDAQNENPLSFPAVINGNWKQLGINNDHELIVIGNYVLDWEPANNNYRLWEFDQTNENVLTGPIKKGTLPKEITKNTKLTGIETLIAKDPTLADIPGTMDFMRDKIEHIIYYMIENRSFDHVCGWLYSKNAPINIIGTKGPYRGVDTNFTNSFNNKDYAITKYNDGKLPDKLTYKNGKPCYEIPDKDLPKDLNSCFVLELNHQDPYHDNSDVLRQMFNKDNIKKYLDKKKPLPDMGGFAVNNGTEEVMLSYSPEQLPVLNGLAENFAICDDWFCSMPGGTDVNRAFALTGSSLGHLNNFQNGVEYTEWSEYPHRPSIWKVLWSNGIKDFKIYNSVEWMNCRFTYNLFLKGQIPSIDDDFTMGNYAPQLNQFYDDLKYNTLPKFSFLEPKWVASAGGSTSYHPGGDLIPGERMLNEVFNAIQESPLKDKILFVITFDEHGGIADHVPPPYSVKPYANDSIGGFDFDIMGVRIPTILVSSWITKNTVFRSDTGTAYDSTSILATLLEWSGIPKSRWGLGERTNHAPTFEAVIREKTARTDKVSLTLPWDSTFPKANGTDEEGLKNSENEKVNETAFPIHDLHELVVPRMVADMTPNLSRAERVKIENKILSSATNLKDLHNQLDELNSKYNK